jgi:hypothetical protein
MFAHRTAITAGLLLALGACVAAAQSPAAGGAPQDDSARTEIRGVLRAFYYHLEQKNWDALSAYVLSPKLLERRGAPGHDRMVTRDRTRTRAQAHVDSASAPCTTKSPPAVDRADIVLDGDWAEVSVPRCSREVAGVDEFRLLYFEQRWRFIYTDLFDARTSETLHAALDH